MTFKCAAALSLSVKTPVDSTTYSAPVSPHGISSGFLEEPILVSSSTLQTIWSIEFDHYQEKEDWNPTYRSPKTVTSFSPKRSVLESLTFTSWCFHWPCTVSYLNMYVCEAINSEQLNPTGRCYKTQDLAISLSKPSIQQIATGGTIWGNIW